MSHLSLIHRFSQEIIDESLEHLNPEPGNFADWEARWAENCGTFRACALVCRRFTPLSQIHIFSVLPLVSRYRGKPPSTEAEQHAARMQGLHDLFASKPYIANRVRHLSLNLTQTRWLMEDSDTKRLLSYLHSSYKNIRMLSLRAPGSQSTTKLSNPQEFYTNFIEPFIPISSISCISIKRIHKIPISLITGCANLSELILDRVSLDEVAQRRPNSSRRPRIRILEFERATGVIRALLGRSGSQLTSAPLLNFSDIHTLQTSATTYTSDSNTDFLVPLVKLCGISIRNLRLRAYGLRDKDPVQHVFNKTVFDLSQFPRLTVLEIRLCIDISVYVDDHAHDACRQLCSFVSTLPPQNELEELTLQVNILTADLGPPELCLDIDWRALVVEISRCVTHRIAPLRFNMKVNYHRDWWNDDIQQACKNTFEAIRERFSRVSQIPDVIFSIRFKSFVRRFAL